jgi:nucleotide-binding universal stress UspA family protein
MEQGFQQDSFSKILVPIDGSAYAKRALRFAVALANSYGAEILALSVIPAASAMVAISRSGVDSYYDDQQNDATGFLTEAVELAAEQNFTKISSKVKRGSESIAQEIIDYSSKENVDLIVMGSRGIGSSAGQTSPFGSVATYVAKDAPCNVITAR